MLPRGRRLCPGRHPEVWAFGVRSLRSPAARPRKPRPREPNRRPAASATRPLQKLGSRPAQTHRRWPYSATEAARSTQLLDDAGWVSACPARQVFGGGRHARRCPCPLREGSCASTSPRACHPPRDSGGGWTDCGPLTTATGAGEHASGGPGHCHFAKGWPTRSLPLNHWPAAPRSLRKEHNRRLRRFRRAASDDPTVHLH
jgi:hypothetical protein